MIRLLRSEIIRAYYWLTDNYIAPYYFKSKGVIFDAKSTKFSGIPYVAKGRDSQIRLGMNTIVNSRERINPLALDHAATFITYDGASISIGNNCALSGAIIIAKTSIEIGDNTMIGANVRIYDTDFHPVDPVLRRQHSTEGARSKPIRIGSNVLVGCHAHILKGVTIADNAVVPAGFVVRKDFPQEHDEKQER